MHRANSKAAACTGWLYGVRSDPRESSPLRIAHNDAGANEKGGQFIAVGALPTHGPISRLADHIFSTIASPNPLHETSVAPSIIRSKSYVTRFCAIVFWSDEMMRSAASGQPM